MNRRGFLGSILALGAAPAIVRADSLMRVVPRETTILTATAGMLTESALEDAMIEIYRLADVRGRLLAIRPTKLYVHPDRVLSALAIAEPLGPKIEGRGACRDAWYLEAK